ncbi:hypothetical protein [Psychrobacillus phage Perkons]|nr:hypothetical protein [Psychrobacillus phage Perkons]
MTETELEKAIKLKQEIKELDDFLFVAERVWTGKIIKKTSSYILQSVPYGAFKEAEYLMNTKMKNKVLDVLRSELSELKDQLQKN